MLEELQELIRTVAREVGPGVVGIGNRWGTGSGLVVAEDRVLTNAHNLRGDQVTLTFDGGRSVPAEVLGFDLDGDLAVLEAETDGAPPIAWASSDAPEIGRPILALANPGGRGLRVTFGLISGTQRSFRGPRGRLIGGSLEHTAPLLPGSSGGPLVDISGGLLGINTNRMGEGFYLAIPADASLRERVGRLGSGESPARPRLGVGIAPAQVARRLRRAVGLPEADGLLVRHVEPEGPAHRAGLREGDLIVEAGGRPTPSVDDLHELLDQAEGELGVKVLRGAEEVGFTVTL
ncbi:MAG: S1C family serine protease [Acidimicrobiia bacterium]